MKNMPTLLAPAGSMRPFMTALRFGADAVYCGAKQYGLRAQANNFDESQLAHAVAVCIHKALGIDLINDRRHAQGLPLLPAPLR